VDPVAEGCHPRGEEGLAPGGEVIVTRAPVYCLQTTTTQGKYTVVRQCLHRRRLRGPGPPRSRGSAGRAQASSPRRCSHACGEIRAQPPALRRCGGMAGSVGARRRADNSRGPGEVGPSGRLRTPFRIPGTLSRPTKPHCKSSARPLILAAETFGPMGVISPASASLRRATAPGEWLRRRTCIPWRRGRSR
jgi:hypothetical protein